MILDKITKSNIIDKVYIFLTVKDLIKLLQSNKKLNKIIKNNSKIYNIILIYENKYLKNKSSNLYINYFLAQNYSVNNLVYRNMNKLLLNNSNNSNIYKLRFIKKVKNNKEISDNTKLENYNIEKIENFERKQMHNNYAAIKFLYNLKDSMRLLFDRSLY